MVIKVLAVGKIKETFFQEAINEYNKRLSKYTKVEIIEILEEKIPEENASYIEIAKAKEGERILKKINDNEQVVLLDLRGQALDSLGFADIIDKLKAKGGTIDFVVGGSYGVSNDVYKRANQVVRFSKLTFPHQLFRVVLLEQIYRSFKILNNEKYHK